MNKWQNYGDVNPIEHGGVWIKQDVENCFLVVRSQPIPNGGYLFEDLYVDITSSWIDWNNVNNVCGEGNTDIDKVLNLINYYSNLEFGNEKKIDDKTDLIDELSQYNIQVEGE